MSVVENPSYLETGTAWIPDGWAATTLGDVADFRGGNAFKEKYQGNVAGEFPFIKVSDFNLPLNQIFIQQANHWIDAVTNKEIKATLFDEGTVVFAKVGAALLLNRRRILTRKTAIDNNLMAAIPRHIHPKFFYYHLQTVDFGKLVQDGAVPSVNQGQLQSLPIAHPPLLEQQKIAAILTVVDDKLDIIARQIKATRTLKQGLMQTLFSKGVGTQDANGHWVPHPEFKDSELGAIPSEWMVTTLGGICNGALQTGPFGSQLHADEYQEVGVPVLMPKDLMNCRANLATAARIAPTRADELSKHKLAAGDLLFSRRGDVTRFALIDEASAGALCGTGCLKAKPSQAHSSAFISHLLQLDVVRTWLEQNAVGQTMPNMNTGILASLPLVVPINKAEQEEIAGILDSIDAKAKVLTAKQAHFQILKRGLMQKLLTGEWRVTLDTQQEMALAA
jgi:type I restriction enzyme S subunit